MDHLHSLDPSVGGSGPHGLTVRLDAHRPRVKASIASRTTCRDDRETPSVESAGRLRYLTTSVIRKGKSFCAVRLTRRAKQAAGFAVMPVVSPWQHAGTDGFYSRSLKLAFTWRHAASTSVRARE